MPRFKSKPFNFFPVLSCIQLFLVITTAGPIFYNCSGDVYFQNSTIATNLNQLYSSLLLEAPLQMFYNITIGEEPHRMYGLFQCRGDITADQCKGCLEISSIEIKQTCPNSTQGVLWYDFCLVQYSNQRFFGSIQTDGFYYYNNKFDRPPFGQVDKALEFVLNLSKQVPSRPSMFATAASSSESIYSLVQCTMDISKEGCQSCLKDVIGKIKGCCSWSRGWRFFTPSCSLRYETYLFFNGSTDHEELQHQYCPNDLSSAILEFNNNLNRLLLTLTSYAPASGFYNAYFGDDPHIVYGLVLCRGDLDRTRCQECLNTAWNDLMITCPNETEAILWYSECQLRYSNQSFFGIADTDGFYDLSNVDDSIGNQSLQAIYRLVKKASEEKLMFTADQLLVNGSEKRFFYAQCTRDIDSNSCHDCLKELIQKVMKCCINMRGWQYYAASCYMRFEDYLFFNIPEVMTPVPQPTPLLQLSPATPPIRHEVVPDIVSREGKKRKSTHVLAISLTVAFLALSLLGLSIFFLLRRKSQKKGRKQHRHHALFDNSGPSGIEVLNTHISGGIQVETQELLLIDFDTIQLATNKFSSENKLGEVKSDVYSFGVLLLEILSGRRNNRSYENAQSLLAYAWQLWRERKVMELIDPILIDACPMEKVLRFIHIGLLCIQEDAIERPTMSTVVVMLEGVSMGLPHPTEPPFYITKRGVTLEQPPCNAETSSYNDLTISEVEPR
ncbi:hypothetical protein MRB53_021290 [Persea americana]|uniref:Uncharacterized protein n=1 Tax=Persea americana TaxID=3435 RepID=A0ACC2L3X6_PERAE|nr:hypothetical protein MRB53_021290 [Persea americana]